MYVGNKKSVEQINFLASSKYQNFTYQISDPGVAETVNLQITSGASASGNVNVVLDGVSNDVAIASGDTAIGVADKIRNASFSGWTTGGEAGTDTVTFTANTVGAKQDAYYSANSTGAAGSETTTIQGADSIEPNEFGKKIVPAGTVYPENGSTAVGILFNDVDVTEGPQPGAVMVEGYVLESRLPESPSATAKSALNKISFR